MIARRASFAGSLTLPLLYCGSPLMAECWLDNYQNLIQIEARFLAPMVLIIIGDIKELIIFAVSLFLSVSHSNGAESQ